MKYFILLPALVLSFQLYAQHCPYDGSHLIALKVVNQNGQLVAASKTSLYLKEINNPDADSCTSSAGLIKKQFLSTKLYTANSEKKYKGTSYGTKLIQRLTAAGVFDSANMVLTLNQAEHTCTLIGKSETVYTNYIYKDRNFVISFFKNEQEIQVPVPHDAIRSLCTATKGLQNFKAIVIQL
jgi:hypothetical protein